MHGKDSLMSHWLVLVPLPSLEDLSVSESYRKREAEAF